MNHTQAPNGHLYGTIEAAKKVGISIRQLYHWVDTLHVVHPQIEQYGLRHYRRFTRSDLHTLEKMKRLTEQGFTPRAAAGIVTRNKGGQCGE